MKRIGPRIDEPTYAFLQACFDNPDRGAGFILEAWPSLYTRTLKRVLRDFTKAELKLMIDVFNATMLTAQMAGQMLVAEVVDGMKLNALDTKWDVNGCELAAKLEGLAAFDAACLELWANSYWYGGAAGQGKAPEQLDDYVIRLP